MSSTTSDTPPVANTWKMPSIVDPSTNKIIKRGRIKSPSELKSAWDSLWWADLDSAEARMKAQQWRDGIPPYSVRRESLMGNSGRTNVNWGLGDQIATDSEMPYNDLLEGVDTLFSMPTNYGEVATRSYNEQVMSEEITRTLRNWPRFVPLYQQLVRLFTNEGIGFCMFEDDFCWPWDVVGTQHIVFPRRIRADVNEIDIVMAQRQLLPHKLFEKCSDDNAAANEGWNREATWEAIKTAAQPTLKANDFQEWEKAWKNHDYILGQTAITVEVIHGWVKEVDGTVSHYIARSDGQGDFLYKKEGKFEDMSRMLVAFLYGIGANGTFHSIHGVLQKTFGAGMAMNKLICRMMDMGIHSSTPIIQAESEEALNELPLTPMGQYVAMSPGYGWVETKLPPFEQSLMPLIGQLTSLLSARSTPFTNTVKPGGNERKTRYQQQSEDEAQAKMSSSGITLFKNSLTQLYREVARRFIRDPYPQSWVGGPEVNEFKARCMSRGVPLEAILQVDVKRIEVNMGIGRGSSAARRVCADSLNTLYNRADAKGQNIINYQIASAYAGSDMAREIFPPQPGLRPPQDLEDANNENASVMSMAAQGLPQTIVVLPTQNHGIHIESHLASLGSVNEMLGSQQIPLEKAITLMNPLMIHTEQHLQMLDPEDPNRSIYLENLKQVREVVTNGARQVAAQQAKMQREMEHNGAASMGPQNENAMAGQPPLNPSVLIQSAELGQKLSDSKFSQAMKVAEFERKQAREDAIAAAQIARAGLPKSAVP